jgi:chemotaxis protein MotB
MAAPEEHHEEGAPEWMVSFADMVTILMAFFVVMYSMGGQKDEKKEEAVMTSLRQHLGRYPGLPKGRLLHRNSKLLKLAAMPEETGKKVRGQQNSNIPPQNPGEPLALGGYLYFDAITETLPEEGQRQIALAAETLSGKPQRIEVRGYTTRRPLPQDSSYTDHWDLAYSRCRQTMQELIRLGIEPNRIRLGIAAQQATSAKATDPRLLVKECRVEIFMLNEFIDQSNDHAPSEPAVAVSQAASHE